MKNTSSRIFIKKENKSNGKTYSPRFEVSFFTFIIIIFALFTNYFKYLFLMYLIAFIHEMSHVIFAKTFKAKVISIRFLPFGFYAEIENLNKLSTIKETIVLLAGPFSYFLSYLILFLLNYNGLISNYTYHISQNSNLVLALFNLIPYYPLDGARLLEIYIAKFISEKKTRIVRLVISFISLSLISFFLYKNNQLVLLVYLIIQYVTELIMFKRQYKEFLYHRLISGPPEKIKITNKDEIFRYYHTYRLENRKIIEEKVIISRIITNMNRRKLKLFGLKINSEKLLKIFKIKKNDPLLSKKVQRI